MKFNLYNINNIGTISKTQSKEKYKLSQTGNNLKSKLNSLTILLKQQIQKRENI